MKVKIYRAATIKQALDQIKRELGPDAFILNRKEIKSKKVLGIFGKSYFEVTAAVDYSQANDKVESGQEIRLRNVQDRLELSEIATQKSRSRSSSSVEIVQPVSSATMSKETQRLIHEIRDLKSLIQSSPEGDSPAKNGRPSLGGFVQPSQQEVYLDLLSQEIDQALAHELVRRTIMGEKSSTNPENTDVARKIQSSLSRRIKIAKDIITLKPSASPQILALLGPTGVGKTTTLAKLAAKAALDGRLKVGLITLDTFRIAAVEQLKTYAEIIGVPTKVVESVSEMQQVIEGFSDRHIILIDTAGKSQRELRSQQELADFMSTNTLIQKALVLSATTKFSDLMENLESYQMFDPDCVIFTKLDETRVYGPILSALIKTQRPLAYVTIGQNVPRDIVKPTSAAIAKLAMKASSDVNQDPFIQLQKDASVSPRKTRKRIPTQFRALNQVIETKHPPIQSMLTEAGFEGGFPEAIGPQA
jgi:flagellar biosynthesis protein FlhF